MPNPTAIYFALVDAGVAFDENVHNVEDLSVFNLEISQAEGGIATATVDILNPRTGFLAAGLKRWVWISCLHDDTGIIPLFYGRIIGIPESLQNEIVRLVYEARPANLATQKAALAESMRVRPYYDPIWLNDEQRDDPDFVLEGYSALWHVDRVSHVLTASNIITAEDGVFEFDDADVFYDSLDVRFTEIPGRVVDVEARVYWEQHVAGELDITQQIYAANAAAGGGNHRIATYTGEGLANDWPDQEDNIGSGWRVARSVLKRGDGIWHPVEATTVVMTTATASLLPIWKFKTEFFVAYDAVRSRSEILRFTLAAGVQDILTEPGEDESIKLSFSSNDVGEPIDPPDTANPDGTLPIVALNRRAYFPTERGVQSLEYLMAVARTELLRRARCVEVAFDVPWSRGLSLSCRHGARIQDYRLPGGEATGKIKSYALVLDGDSGEAVARVRIGCTIGEGATVSVVAGDPDYVDTDYVEDDYQFFIGRTEMPFAGELSFEDFSDTPPNDDGLDFDNLLPADVIELLEMVFGLDDQKTAIKSFSVVDIEGVVKALEEIYSTFRLQLVPLKQGPFETVYDVTVSDLAIPRTIDLEAT